MEKGKVGLCQIIWMTCFEVSPSDSPGATKEEPDSAVGKNCRPYESVPHGYDRFVNETSSSGRRRHRGRGRSVDVRILAPRFLSPPELASFKRGSEASPARNTDDKHPRSPSAGPCGRPSSLASKRKRTMRICSRRLGLNRTALGCNSSPPARWPSTLARRRAEVWSNNIIWL